MTAPWIEIKEFPRPDVPAGPGYAEYTWQAQFACQVKILPHLDWVKLKWGFNALALFEEALERQRLFLESQYGAWPDYGVEPADYRTLVYRFVNRPGEGLSLAVLGKIHAKTEADARKSACSYYRELKSTFPYDYFLKPAGTEQEFNHMSARDILNQDLQPLGLAQIKRLELPLYADRSAPLLHGVWHSGPRTHEQIWRSLAASPSPVLLNVSLRRTVLYDTERDLLSKTVDEVSGTRHRKAHSKSIVPLQNWHQIYVDRRLAPWEKFFYLQVHLASSQELSEDLFRTIGTSLSARHGEDSLPGFEVLRPREAEAPAWQKHLMNLDLIRSTSYLPIQRLSEVADLEEVFAVLRLPYSPPENGFPDMSFVTMEDRPDTK